MQLKSMIWLAVLASPWAWSADVCVPIDRAGYVIDKPGNYCLTRDIDTRLDFADHSAEAAIVDIRSSNVVLNLMGHRGGRGKFFTQHGGNGVKIDSCGVMGCSNITIKNGLLSDFDHGVYFYRNRDWATDPKSRDAARESDNIFVYSPASVRIEGVVFRRCTTDIKILDSDGS